MCKRIFKAIQGNTLDNVVTSLNNEVDSHNLKNCRVEAMLKAEPYHQIQLVYSYELSKKVKSNNPIQDRQSLKEPYNIDDILAKALIQNSNDNFQPNL